MDNKSKKQNEAKRTIWQPDGKEYFRRVKMPIKDAQQDEKEKEHNESLCEDELKPPIKKPESETKDVAQNIGVRKYRLFMKKWEEIPYVQHIAKDALGKKIIVHNFGNIPGQRSMDEELYNDGVNEKEFVKDTLRDYDSDLEAICNQDNNNDGKVDDNDITPGMSRMMRYI